MLDALKVLFILTGASTYLGKISSKFRQFTRNACVIFPSRYTNIKVCDKLEKNEVQVSNEWHPSSFFMMSSVHHKYHKRYSTVKRDARQGARLNYPLVQKVMMKRESCTPFFLHFRLQMIVKDRHDSDNKRRKRKRSSDS